MPSFGDNLRAAMHRSGFERDTFAEKLGVTVPQIDKWLHATANPTLDTLFRLCGALQVSVEALVTGVNAEYDAQRRAGTDRQRLLELCSLLTDAQARALIPTVALLAGSDADVPPPEEAP